MLIFVIGVRFSTSVFRIGIVDHRLSSFDEFKQKTFQRTCEINSGILDNITLRILLGNEHAQSLGKFLIYLSSGKK